MIRCNFRPNRNSERDALRRFPGWWMVRQDWPDSRPGCVAICPVGHPDQTRWVERARVTMVLADLPLMEI